MTKKQCIISGIIAAILTAAFLYTVFYFPHALVEGMFWVTAVGCCFGVFYLIVAIIWTKGEILPNPYPTIYAFDPDIEEKLRIIEERKKKEKNKCSLEM